MDKALEKAIVARGRRLYEAIGDRSPSLFKKGSWSARVLDWAMRNPDFKVQLFRFVDVLPALDSGASFASHLQEYFCGPDCETVPPVLRWGASVTGRLGGLTAKVVAGAVRTNLEAMARGFMVGGDAGQALARVAELRRRGYAITLGILGEETLSEDEADRYLEGYLAMLDRLSRETAGWPALGGAGELDWGASPKASLTIKPSMFHSQARPQAPEASLGGFLARLEPLYRKVIDHGASLCVDMEQHRYKEVTQAIYRSLRAAPRFRHYPHLRIAMQSYLRDSERDLAELLAWARREKLPVAVRLVKGAYWDYETAVARQNGWRMPVWTDKARTDLAFERQARLILENHDICHLAVASHNIRSIAAVLETAAALGVPPERYEFELLYGMAEPVREALLKEVGRVRLYCPYGDLLPGMAYLVRRLLENTANESIVRQGFVEGARREALLADPREALRDAPEEEDAPPGGTAAPGRGLPPFANHPLADFTREELRLGMRKALDQARRELGRTYPLHIDGRDLATGRTADSLNPADPREVVGRVCQAGIREADLAMEAAGRAFPAWRDTPAKERAAVLLRAAEGARRRVTALAAWQVLEVGKQWDQAYNDVGEAVDFLEYYARRMLELDAPRRLGDLPGELNLMFYRPRGVAVVIAPWNFPLAISCGMSAAALAAGNTVVYKPSSLSAVVGRQLVELLAEAGLPPGVFNFCPGPGGEVGGRLTSHPLASIVAFTGSTEVGLAIARAAAELGPDQRQVKRVIAEMGGKNAVIVDEDADLDQAVPQVLASAFGFQGQKCSACSRVIVLESVRERFLERLAAAAASLRVGPAEDPANYLGPVVDAAQQAKVLSYLELAAREGRVVFRGQVPREGYYAPPAIVDGVPPDHRLAQEEIFGPLLVVLAARDFGHALELANGTRQALTGGVFSRSPANLERARREFRVGNLYLNRGVTGALVGRQPFGGFGTSGVGFKAGGPDYLLQFLDCTTVTENTMRRGFTPLSPDDRRPDAA